MRSVPPPHATLRTPLSHTGHPSPAARPPPPGGVRPVPPPAAPAGGAVSLPPGARAPPPMRESHGCRRLRLSEKLNVVCMCAMALLSCCRCTRAPSVRPLQRQALGRSALQLRPAHPQRNLPHHVSAACIERGDSSLRLLPAHLSSRTLHCCSRPIVQPRRQGLHRALVPVRRGRRLP